MVFSFSTANAPRKPTPLGWRVVSLLSKRKATLLGLGTLIVLATCLDIAVPFLTKSIIDRVLQAFGKPAADSIQTLVWAALSIFGATAGTRLLRSFYNFRLVQTAAAAEDDAKNRAFANFLGLDTAFHTSVNTGEIVGALDRGGTAVFVILNEILGQNLVPPLLIAFGVLTSLVCKNVWIALIVFAPLPAYLAIISRLGSRMQTLEQRVNKSFETVTKESYDIASNVRLVKKFGQEKTEAATQRKLLTVARGHHHRAERLWAPPMPAPVRNRQAKYHVGFIENAVSTVATV